MTSLRVAVFPADEGGCGHYRLIWPALALKAQGADVQMFLPSDNEGQISGTFVDDPDGTPRLVKLGALPDAEVLVFQRPLARQMADAIPLIQATGRRVVVELDDDFSCIHPRNSSWKACHPQHSPHRNFQHLQRACAAADLITVTTPALAARYGAHGRTVVIPNYIPEWVLDLEPLDLPEFTGPLLGWSGSVGTHPDDLQVAGQSVGKACRSNGAGFRVIGTGQSINGNPSPQEALDLRGVQFHATGWVTPFERYFAALATLDLGVVPLKDTAFNRGKSWLKGLEMAAVGVPFVASPTPDYTRLAKLGAGMLADTPRQWTGCLGYLLRSPDHYNDMRGRGLAVARSLTVEAHAWRWAEAWESTLARKKAA